MSDHLEPVSFAVKCLQETDRAVLVEFDDGDKEWIPKSQIEGGEVWAPGDEGTMTVTGWLAQERGWA